MVFGESGWTDSGVSGVAANELRLGEEGLEDKEFEGDLRSAINLSIFL